MDTGGKKYRILQLLAENEEAIARLYRAYAEKFPRYQDFWSDLAQEEIQHSHWIQKLSSMIDYSVEIKEDKFDMKVFQISSDYLDEKLDQAKNEKISFKDALSIALDIETGMLERGYFKVFEGDSQELKKIFHALATATEKHTNKIREVLGKKRRRFF